MSRTTSSTASTTPRKSRWSPAPSSAVSPPTRSRGSRRSSTRRRPSRRNALYAALHGARKARDDLFELGIAGDVGRSQQDGVPLDAIHVTAGRIADETVREGVLRDGLGEGAGGGKGRARLAVRHELD